uniref:Iron-binding zinc finger CDGSH type domain-containing protein n=1 Tax=Oryzias latipes TaxID=8090 RepID=A0A3B3IBF5_ORYLA
PFFSHGTNRSAGVVRLSTLPPDPVIPSKKPFKVELSGGKRYSWCSCGLSRKQVGPLGSSAGSNPVCPLMGSGPPPSPSPPFCDGTHKQNFVVSALLLQHCPSLPLPPPR